MMHPLPHVSHAYRLIVQEEKQRAASEMQAQSSNAMAYAAESSNARASASSNTMTYATESSDARAFAADHRRPYRPPFNQSSTYNQAGSSRTTFYNRRSGRSGSGYYCDHCKIPGHTMERCWKIHGYPPHFQQNNKDKGKRVAAAVAHDDEMDTGGSSHGGGSDHGHITAEQYYQLMELLNKQKDGNAEEPHASVAGICLLTSLNAKWIVDSGATHHICSNLSLFAEYKTYNHAHNSITVADGKKSIVKHIGSVNLGNGITLYNVMHVPGFKYNLISAHQLCKDLNCSIIFTHDKCILQELSQKSSLVLGELKSGLYAVTEDKGMISKGVAVVASEGKTETGSEEAKLWHLRLGHMPFNKLHHVCSVHRMNKCPDSICQICPRARQSRLPFPVSSIHASKRFELLHIDLWGPYIK